MRLYKTYEKLCPTTINPSNILAMPRSIVIYRNCVKHEVQSALIKRLHFNDLYLLLMALDIADLKQTIQQIKKEKMRTNGISEIRDLTPEEAVKFQKGG